jgi:formiminoglutamase
MTSLDQPSQELFFSKNDSEDPRLGELAKITRVSELHDSSFAILGYPDDEGIRLNGGRPGAAAAPDVIRSFLYKMTPSPEAHEKMRLCDLGNLPVSGDLNTRHKAARTVVAHALHKGATVLTLGGGHDYGYPDMAAFCETSLARGRKPFVINFDAHLDLRPNTKGNHSGTPFFNLLSEFKNQIDFVAVGLQDWCNSSHHWNWGLTQGADLHSYLEILASGETLATFVEKRVLSRITSNHDLALSVDFDCFASAFVPGASQVFPTGLRADEFLMLWRIMTQRFKPALAGFYEVSPPLDFDGRGARLAAILIHQFFALSKPRKT